MGKETPIKAIHKCLHESMSGYGDWSQFAFLMLPWEAMTKILPDVSQQLTPGCWAYAKTVTGLNIFFQFSCDTALDVRNVLMNLIPEEVFNVAENTLVKVGIRRICVCVCLGLVVL